MQGDTTLLHKFVLDNCPPKLSEKAIAAHLRAMDEDLPVNSLDEDGLNPLHIAICKGNSLMVERLLSCIGNMDINARTAKGKTPIQLAVETEHLEVVDILSRNGVDIKECLLQAARRDKWSIVKELLPRGHFVNLVDHEKRTLLHWAAINGNLNMARQLISLGCEVDAKDRDGETALITATHYEHWEVVKELLTRNASVNVTDEWRRSPLHWVAEYGNLQMVKEFLLLGCEFDANDCWGRTALYYSAFNNHRDVFEELLAKTGDISNDENRTLLHCSAMCGSMAGVRKSLLLGCNIDEGDREGETALVLAAQNSHWETVKELLSRNASVNVSDGDERYPLHWAAQHGNLDIVKQILHLGGKIDAKDRYENTARDLAVGEGHDEIAQLLSSHESVADDDEAP